MQTVTAQAVPNQQLQCSLANQAVTLNIYQQNYGMFMDVYVAGEPVILGVLCLNLTRIVRNAYLGFLGDLMWYDSQGNTNPVYSGIGTRYQLTYVTQADLTAAGLSG